LELETFYQNTYQIFIFFKAAKKTSIFAAFKKKWTAICGFQKSLVFYYFFLFLASKGLLFNVFLPKFNIKLMYNSDKEIIQGIKAGDKRALTILYNTYWKVLYISSYNILKNKEVCEEIIQDVFIDIWNKQQELKIKVSLKSYLYACVRYKVFAEFKKNKIIRVELFNELDKRLQYTTPETKMMHDELEKEITFIVGSLPNKCKKVYQLSRNEQLSHKEIAEMLGISVKTVENHITNALRVLRTSLGHALFVTLYLNQ